MSRLCLKNVWRTCGGSSQTISVELVWLRVVDLQAKLQSRWNQQVLERIERESGERRAAEDFDEVKRLRRMEK